MYADRCGPCEVPLSGGGALGTAFKLWKIGGRGGLGWRAPLFLGHRLSTRRAQARVALLS